MLARKLCDMVEGFTGDFSSDRVIKKRDDKIAEWDSYIHGRGGTSSECNNKCSYKLFAEAVQ